MHNFSISLLFLHAGGGNTWFIILPKQRGLWYRDLQKELNQRFPLFSFISPGVFHIEEVKSLAFCFQVRLNQTSSLFGTGSTVKMLK